MYQLLKTLQFNELWNMNNILLKQNYSRIRKDKFYPLLEKEINKLLSSPSLNMKEMKFLETFVRQLKDATSFGRDDNGLIEFKRFIGKYMILIENWIIDKFITNKINYSYHDLLDLIFTEERYQDGFILKGMNSKVKNYLANLHKPVNSFNVQNQVFNRLYKKRDAIKFLGKKSYLKIINSLFTVIENQTKKTDIKKIFYTTYLNS